MHYTLHITHSHFLDIEIYKKMLGHRNINFFRFWLLYNDFGLLIFTDIYVTTAYLS